jgi:hypothetical protein
VYSLDEQEKKRMKRRFSQEQIIGILKQQESESGVTTAEVCREHIPAPTPFMLGKPSLAA